MKMTRHLLATLGIATAMLYAGCNTSSDKNETVELFNGQNLDGWIHLFEESDSPASVAWAVDEGVLTCQGEPFGYLYTKQSFQDFRLEVEYRWVSTSDPRNNGIFSRVQDPTSGAIPRCVETQLNAGQAGDLMTMQGMKMDTDQARFFHIPNHELAGEVHGVTAITNVERPGGEWNQITVIARGGTYTVIMNGQEINQAMGIPELSGPIGLQCEGGVIQYRRVAITPL
jgi:hypothetical protein